MNRNRRKIIKNTYPRFNLWIIAPAEGIPTEEHSGSILFGNGSFSQRDAFGRRFCIMLAFSAIIESLRGSFTAPIFSETLRVLRFSSPEFGADDCCCYRNIQGVDSFFFTRITRDEQFFGDIRDIFF